MGVVYRAHNPRLNRDVALKVLLAGEQASPAQRQRFLLEAQAAARLRHPHIVPVHDVGEEGGRLFLAMEFVEGMSLADRLSQEGPLEPREAARLLAPVARALHAAHEALVLHRDVKPSNVLIDVNGRPLLADFGLAKVMDDEARGPTRSGQVLGTPAYMAPEQASGRLVDWRTDVYGLGATLYEVLVGEPPFDGDTAIEVISRLVNEEVARPTRWRPGLDQDIETICLKCLEKDPAHRYPSAAELADDLERYLRGEPIEARRPGGGERLAKWVRRNPALARGAATGLALALLGVIGAAGWVQLERRAAAEREVEARADTRAALRGEARAAAELALRLQAEAPADADTQTALGLEALQASQRWYLLADDDAAAAEACYRAATRLGEAALTSEQWALAARSFAQAEGLGVDNAAAQAGRERVERARAAESERRAEEIRALLEAARREGATTPGLLDDAVFRLVRYAEPQTVALLCEALQAATASLRAGQRLDAGEVTSAELACRALGRIGLREGAVGALVAYMEAERDELRAAWAGVALIRLGDEGGVDRAFAARRRWGANGNFAARLQRALTTDRVLEEAGGPVQAVTDAALQGTDVEPTSLRDALRSLMESAERKSAAGDLRGALALYDRAVGVAPGNASGWLNRGKVRSDLGDHQGALADYQRAAQAEPGFALAWVNMGTALRDLDRPHEALEALTRAAQLEQSAVVHYNLALLRQQLGDLKGALADLDLTVKLDPNLARGWVVRATVRRSLGDLSGALADTERALEVDPQSAMAWTARGAVRENHGDVQGALDDYARSLELDPTRTDTWGNRARVRLNQGDTAGAVEDFTRLIELAPDEAASWADRGLARMRLGDLDGAYADMTRCLELYPDAAPVWFNRGNVQRMRQLPELAHQDYTRAIEFAPEMADAWANRGLARRELGDARGAAEDLRRTLELAPDHPDADTLRSILAALDAD